MATQLAQISASRKRRQPHKRQGTRLRKFSMSMPPEIDALIAKESDEQGRTQAAVVADRLRESYGIAPAQVEAE